MRNAPRRAPTAAAAALGAATLLAGCSLTPPERPAYTGTDRVGTDVDPASLVGAWRVTPLNPYPDEEPQDTIIEYRADGTLSGVLEPRGEESIAAFGAGTSFTMSGDWTLVDGTVSHSDVRMESSSDNPLARLTSGFINGTSLDIDGTADILELEPDRIVMLGTDGAAMRYDRVE